MLTLNSEWPPDVFDVCTVCCAPVLSGPLVCLYLHHVHQLSGLFVSPPSHFGSTGWVSVEAGHTRGEYLGFLGTSVKDLRS